MKVLPRTASGRLEELLKAFPAVLVLGPRQCGKSTLVRSVLATWRHLDLERPADRALLEADLEGFLEANARRVVFDEAQRLPELFSAIRHAIDRGSGKGRFVLTGSANPALVRDVSETLAGRVGILELTPFRSRELSGRHLRDRWFWGGYPPVLRARSHAHRTAWLDAYVTTFLERDLPTLGLGVPPTRLRTLWSMLTHVHGNLLTVADLGRSLGVTSPTVSRYLDILEGAFMIRRLPPLHANVQKRLTKSPKLYIRGTGVLHFLAGLRAPADLETWARRGASFEGLVIEEITALATDHLVRPVVAFWRTQAGAEVDLLVGEERDLRAVEIKSTSKVTHYDVAGLRRCMADLGLTRGWVVANVAEATRLGKDIEIVPWSSIADGSFAFGWDRPRRRRRSGSRS